MVAKGTALHCCPQTVTPVPSLEAAPEGVEKAVIPFRSPVGVRVVRRNKPSLLSRPGEGRQEVSAKQAVAVMVKQQVLGEQMGFKMITVEGQSIGCSPCTLLSQL